MNANAESEFSNADITPDLVPDYREARFEPLAAAYRRYVVTSTVGWWLPVVLAVVVVWLLPVVALEPRFLGAAGIVSAVALTTGVYRWVDAGYRGWALREHDIIARSGVAWRSITALPIARIQHVETSHGPLERWYGIARLKLFTAGGMTADLVVIGLARGTADRLREYLVEQIRLRDEQTRRSTDG